MIFVIGINKTGLTTASQALRILGYNGTQHPAPEIGEKILRGEIKMDFLSDMPVMTDFDLFDKAFPNSKFIVTHRRDNDAWLASSLNQRKKMKARGVEGYGGVYRMKMYGTQKWIPEEMVKKKIEHYQRIDEYFKDRPQDVLHMNIIEDGDGWEKLCPFLGEFVREIPFPHRNKTEPEFNDVEI